MSAQRPSVPVETDALLPKLVTEGDDEEQINSSDVDVGTPLTTGAKIQYILPALGLGVQRH